MHARLFCSVHSLVTRRRPKFQLRLALRHQVLYVAYYHHLSLHRLIASTCNAEPMDWQDHWQALHHEKIPQTDLQSNSNLYQFPSSQWLSFLWKIAFVYKKITKYCMEWTEPENEWFGLKNWWSGWMWKTVLLTLKMRISVKWLDDSFLTSHKSASCTMFVPLTRQGQTKFDKVGFCLFSLLLCKGSVHQQSLCRENIARAHF